MSISALNHRRLPDLTEVRRFWKANGLKDGTIKSYSSWVTRFCRDHHPDIGIAKLTARGVRSFGRRFAKRHQIAATTACLAANSALRAWSEALCFLGVSVPTWCDTCQSQERVVPLLKEYLDDRRTQLGGNASRERRDLADLKRWFCFLRSRGKDFCRVQIKDVDDYLVFLKSRFASATICNRLSAVRQFLRFLYTTGRLRHNLAEAVQSPQRRRSELPRTLRWPEIQRILRSVECKSSLGRRDYAVLLLMSVYGLGAAEIIDLTLDRLDWEGQTVTVRRPKTGSIVRLPLLPAVARALAAYLRHGRPVNAPTRAVFIRQGFPHKAFTSSVVRYMVRKYAHRAGIHAPILGAHVLRHSYATRQINQNAPARVLGEILGHRDPESTSVYTRVAVERLRRLSLPVPQ